MTAKYKMLCLAVCVALLFTGCGPLSFQSVNELLRAPALGQRRGEIQKALAAYLEEEPQYKFPKEGDWRSPLVIEDFDGDGQEEAVLFYSVLAGTSAVTKDKTNDVYIALLCQIDGQWQVILDEKGLSTDVASVDVADLFGDGSKQLVVGYASSSLANKTLALYHFAGEEMKMQQAGFYENYLLGDFAGTGHSELAIVSLLEEGGGLRLNFLSGVGGVFEYTQKGVDLSPNFSTCVGLHPSVGPDGSHYLVVDGRTHANYLASQILNYSGSGEGFYSRADTADLVNLSMRYSPLLTSMDINGDGMVEIPVDSERELLTESGDVQLREVQWYNFYESTPTVVEWGILDTSRDIYVSLPAGWHESYKVTDGAARGDWQVRSRRTGEVWLELRAILPGEVPPGESKRVPGEANLYVFPAAHMSVQEKSQIRVISLS